MNLLKFKKPSEEREVIPDHSIMQITKFTQQQVILLILVQIFLLMIVF
jgi:hypothetical protein